MKKVRLNKLMLLSLISEDIFSRRPAVSENTNLNDVSMQSGMYQIVSATTRNILNAPFESGIILVFNNTNAAGSPFVQIGIQSTTGSESRLYVRFRWNGNFSPWRTI